ncbi:histone-lysine N-methyltransferase SETMAR [Plakobranchus ocellatus]|uniref:Histone-lysine N-methyltransferase SETMAR n=1 Tax=Plakobranchus ocellatus TaxID=259542 RepID=A0AAV4C698_9GAST|nr:histone-lysine N-methyltransferase SETMAR [Plakobranchus ocellatus]
MSKRITPFASRYCSTLDRLKEAIRRKRPGLLRRGVVLQHDNATPHSANLTQQWLQRYGWEILPHPAHSSDLAPSDFHLFGLLKRHLGGMASETEDDLISKTFKQNMCYSLAMSLKFSRKSVGKRGRGRGQLRRTILLAINYAAQRTRSHLGLQDSRNCTILKEF